jgi:selenoprotein W-related protein
VSAVSDLLSNYQHVITDVALVMGGSGVFDVTVDGEMLYSKKETGRHAEDDEVLSLFSELVGDIKRYGE